MNRLFFSIIITIFAINCFGFFTTEYATVDSLSEEWQQAGIIGGVLPEADMELTIDNSYDINYVISNLGVNGSPYENYVPSSDNIIRIELTAGEYLLNNSIILRSYVILSGNHQFRRDEDRSERTILNFDITGIEHNKKNCIVVEGTDIEPITHVGVEDILINRIDSGSSNHNEDNHQGDNINFTNAENCWVYGVESRDPIKHHIHIGKSNHIEIAGCYFHDAQFQGEGGYGYGIIIEYGSTHCLAENNIFYKCRHAMLVQNEAHYNVFGYNHVAKGKQATLENLEFNNCPPWFEDFLGWLLGICIPGDFIGDICCHGESSYENSLPAGTGYRGPYSNLFEGNICNAMWVDSFHGKNKKFNTFFRNRAKKYGFSIFDKLPDALSDRYYTKRQTKQIAVNNYMKSTLHWTDTWEITTLGVTVSSLAAVIHDYNLSIMGFYLTIAFLEEYADLTRGRWVDKKPFEKNSIHKRKNFWGQYYTRTWTDDEYGTDMDAWNDNSYYLSSNPDFWPTATGLSWPFHPKDSSEIPAKRRYSLFDKKTVSRYDGNSIVTFYVTEDATVPDDISDDLLDNGNLVVPSGVALYISPNTTLQVRSGSSIRIRGSLFAENVTFTEKVQDEAWAGLHFGLEQEPQFWNNNFNYTEYAESSILKNCVIKNAKAVDNPFWHNSVYFYNCSTGGGINVNHYNGLVLKNCTIEDNQALWGGGLYCEMSNVTLDNCEIRDNTAEYGGGGIYSFYSLTNVLNCRVKNNVAISDSPYQGPTTNFYSYGGGGLYICCEDEDNEEEDALIFGNIIEANNAEIGGGISLDNVHNCYLINNTIVDNNAILGGGGIYSALSNIDFYNNIVWNNNANHSLGNQFYLEILPNDYCILFMNNTIDYGNDSSLTTAINNPNNHEVELHNWETNDNVIFSGIDENNQNFNPLFANDFTINSNSPCFNTGVSIDDIKNSISQTIAFPNIDLYGNPRLSSNVIDIGACEAYSYGIYIDEQELNLDNVNPDNPITTSFILHNQSSVNSISNISCVISGEIDDFLEVVDCPATISPESTGIIKLKFAPTQMYRNYSGQITINSDDPFFPELTIPFYAFTGFHRGWNWCSFPFESLNSQDIFDSFDPFGLSIAAENGYMTYNNAENSWDSYGLTNFENNKGYKVQMISALTSYDIDATGAHPYTSITLYPNQYNWVGYWQLGSQNFDDAFGEDFDKVISIKSETWFYGELSNPRGGIIPVPKPSNTIRALHYGRGYMVEVSEIIEEFNWGYSGGAFKKDEIKQPTAFTFEQKSDYEAIDVVGLNDDDIEIGAFVDSTCVGAAVVENNQAQILAYTENIGRYNPEISFKVLSQRGKQSLDEYFVFNNHKNEFEAGKIFSNRSNYHLVSFSKDINDQETVPDKIILIGNSPNPFNPTTTIDFSIPEDSKVDVSIFNVKGQKVKTLLNKFLLKGRHQVLWNGVDNTGKAVSSGVYFYKLSVKGKSEVIKKCLLLK